MFDELRSWFKTLRQEKSVETDETTFVLEQAKFLLTQAALVEVQSTSPGFETSTEEAYRRISRIGTPYAYMNPITFSKITFRHGIESHGLYYKFPESRTRWILTTLLPENTMIAGPNLLPGLEQLMKEQDSSDLNKRASDFAGGLRAEVQA